jgi:hypothetical protein
MSLMILLLTLCQGCSVRPQLIEVELPLILFTGIGVRIQVVIRNHYRTTVKMIR